MNKQISELIKQAGTDTSGKWLGVDHTEKLVELIVRECIKINKDLMHGEVELNSHRRSHNNALDESNFYIKQHFGVKE
jgi:hypothetical protein